MNKILITGGAGFIGSNLCEYFLNKGYEIVCLDNLSTGFIKNIDDFLSHPNFKFIEGDIRDFNTCKYAIIGCNYVLHQAALGSVPRSIKDPLVTNDVNVNGFLNMLIAAKDEKVKRFIYAASSSTYGDSQFLPKIEDIIGKPLSPYAVTKYVNELYADVFSKIYGIEAVGLRYFNVFGRRQNPEGQYAAVIPKFINKLLKNESPVINGDGYFSRDFTYIDNILQINELAMLTKDRNAINTIYNAAYGQSTTLNQLVFILKEKLSYYNPSIKNIVIQYTESRLGDIPHSLASIAKSKDLLGYDPKYNLQEGLTNSIDWYCRNSL